MITNEKQLKAAKERLIGWRQSFEKMHDSLDAESFKIYRSMHEPTVSELEKDIHEFEMLASAGEETPYFLNPTDVGIILVKKVKVKKIWSPHPYLVAAFRKVWYWSPERRQALAAAKIGKDTWQCATCPNTITKEKYVTKKGRNRTRMTGSVDHIVPIGKQPRSWNEYNEYLAKTFCDASNLQVLCKPCHSVKSKAEGKTRV